MIFVVLVNTLYIVRRKGGVLQILTDIYILSPLYNILVEWQSCDRYRRVDVVSPAPMVNGTLYQTQFQSSEDMTILKWGVPCYSCLMTFQASGIKASSLTEKVMRRVINPRRNLVSQYHRRRKHRQSLSPNNAPHPHWTLDNSPFESTLYLIFRLYLISQSEATTHSHRVWWTRSTQRSGLNTRSSWVSTCLNPVHYLWSGLSSIRSLWWLRQQGS